MIQFKTTLSNQADLLSEIAIQSKAHWGYGQELLDLWREDLRVKASYIEANTVQVILLNNNIVGFFALKQGEQCYLDQLWLLPSAIGKGVGKAAFHRVIAEFRERSVQEFFIISDPHAERFYLSQGAVKVAEVDSVPQGRKLPKLRMSVCSSDC